MRKTFKFVAGAIAGAILGGVVVILLTPESGSDTRTAISEKIQYLRSQVQEAARERRIELEAEIENYKKA